MSVDLLSSSLVTPSLTERLLTDSLPVEAENKLWCPSVVSMLVACLIPRVQWSPWAVHGTESDRPVPRLRLSVCKVGSRTVTVSWERVCMGCYAGHPALAQPQRQCGSAMPSWSRPLDPLPRTVWRRVYRTQASREGTEWALWGAWVGWCWVSLRGLRWGSAGACGLEVGACCLLPRAGGSA